MKLQHTRLVIDASRDALFSYNGSLSGDDVRSQFAIKEMVRLIPLDGRQSDQTFSSAIQTVSYFMMLSFTYSYTSK